MISVPSTSLYRAAMLPRSGITVQSVRCFATAQQPVASTSTSAAPTHHLITLRRSALGLPSRSQATLESLGLHRLHQSVLHPFGGTVAGKILKVKELVEVVNVTEEVGRAQLGRRRGEGVGLQSTGRAWGGSKSI